MKTHTFHIYDLTPELFIEALIEKAYHLNEGIRVESNKNEKKEWEYS